MHMKSIDKKQGPAQRGRRSTVRVLPNHLCFPFHDEHWYKEDSNVCTVEACEHIFAN